MRAGEIICRRIISGIAIIIVTGLLVFGTSAPAQADTYWSGSISCNGSSCTSADEGYDLDVYYDLTNGWINVTATNTSSVAWGDFHFFIFGIPNNDSSNVVFDVASPNQPTSSQSPLTWSLDSSGKYLDLYFYSDPVNPGTAGTFNVYAKNPDGVQFGVGFYPSVVPEPISSTLFIIGGATLGLRRFWKKRANA